MPICVGRSNATLSPVWPASSSMAEAAVRLGRRAEAGVLAHRPQPAAVHRRLHAARERKRARVAEVARVVERRVVGPVDGIDRNSRRCRCRAVSHSRYSRLGRYVRRYGNAGYTRERTQRNERTQRSPLRPALFSAMSAFQRCWKPRPRWNSTRPLRANELRCAESGSAAPARPRSCCRCRAACADAARSA